MRHLTAIPFLVLVVAVSLPTPAHAGDVRIGYTNVELVLSMMPEARQVEQQLQTFQGQLEAQLQTKQEYAQQRLEEYMDRQSRGDLTPDQDSQYVVELTALDAEIQSMVSEAEQKLVIRRGELLEPVVERLQTAIDEVAAEGGFTYILNQTTSAGVSTLLYGPDEDDITAALLAKLGISTGG